MKKIRIKIKTIPRKTADNTKNASTDDKKNLPPIEDTAILEYYDLIKNEYDIERKRKESFENRAGIIIPFIGTFLVLLFDKINLYKIFTLFNDDLNFLLFLKIVFGTSIYVFLLLSLFFLLYVIKPNLHDNYNTNIITPEKIINKKIYEIKDIIMTYRDIISNRRNNNKHKSDAYNCALWFLLFMIISLIAYTGLGGVK